MLEVFKSSRFQALVIAAIIWALGQYGLIADGIVEAFMVVLLGHVGVRTADKAAEKVGGSLRQPQN